MNSKVPLVSSKNPALIFIIIIIFNSAFAFIEVSEIFCDRIGHSEAFFVSLVLLFVCF